MKLDKKLEKAYFILTLTVLTTLCISAGAQDTTDDWYKKGQELMENGSYQEALKAYDNAARMDSENASIWMGKGDTLIRMGNYNESQNIYKRASEIAYKIVKDNPQDAKGWFVSGELLQRQSKDDEAIKAFDKAIEANPNYAEAWSRKGAILQNRAWGLPTQESIKTFEESLEAQNKAIELNPGYGKAWSEKGYALSYLASQKMDLDTYYESLDAFDRAIELISVDDTRNLALAWEGKALALTGMGNLLKDMNRQEEAKEKYEDATNNYDKVIELDPEFTGQEARLTKAGLLCELGRYNESLAAYDEAIFSMPAEFGIFNATLMASKGDVLAKMGGHEESLKTFDAALQIDPTNAVAWKGKGDALNEMRRYDEAIKAYDKAIELGPEIVLLKAYSWQGKADALLAQGRQFEANAAYVKAKELGYED